MHKMMELYDHMADEAKDGKAYAKSAMACRDTDRHLSELYSSMAKERMAALRKLKDQSVRLYEYKVNHMKDRGEDIKHVTEMHDWMCKMACTQECELSHMIESVR